MQFADIVFVSAEVVVVETLDEVGAECILFYLLLEGSKNPRKSTDGCFADFINPTRCTIVDLINAVSCSV